MMRDIEAAPWCWQEKAALRLIRDGCEDVEYLTDVLAVYLALTEIASDRQSDSFEASERDISRRSGVSKRQVNRVKKKLRALRVLDWLQNLIPGTKEQGPCTYTLLQLTPRSARESLPSDGVAPPTASDQNGKLAECMKNPLQQSPLKNGENKRRGRSRNPVPVGPAQYNRTF